MKCKCTDIHTHVVPGKFPRYMGSNTNVPWPSMADAHACHKHVMIEGKVYRTVSDGCWSPSRRIADMAEMHIERQALSPMPELLSYWLPLADARVMIRFLNEQIAEMVAHSPDQFTGLGAVPLQDVEAAIYELEYVMKTLKFAGVEIASHVNGVSIGDPRFEPFFAAAVDMGAAIFVHALRPDDKGRIVGKFPEQAVCFPNDIALAAASMITGGIGSRHPELRIAFSHGGGSLPILLPRLIQCWKFRPGLEEELTESPDVIARRFFYDCLHYDPRATRFLIEMVGSSQVVIGTDYPFSIHDKTPLKSLEKMELDDATMRAITSENATRFLGLTLG